MNWDGCEGSEQGSAAGLSTCPLSRGGRKVQHHTGPEPALGGYPDHRLLTFCRQRRQEEAKGEKRQRCRQSADGSVSSPLSPHPKQGL